MSELRPLADEPEALTDAERRALEAGLAGPRVPAGAREAVWRTLGAVLPAGAAAAPALTLAALAKQLGLGLLLGTVAALGGAFAERLAPGPAVPVTLPTAAPAVPSRTPFDRTAVLEATDAGDAKPVLSTRAAPASPLPAPPVTSPPLAGASSSPAAARARGSAASFPVEPPASSRESRELAQARSLLRAHRAEETLERLQELARRYPHGALVQEREELTIEALLALGEREAARRRARVFVERYPESPYLAVARRALE